MDGKSTAKVEVNLRYPGHFFEPEDLLSFIESQVFRTAWKRCDLTDEDLMELQLGIMAHPKVGAVIEGTGGVRKLRFSPTGRGKGKSGSHRVLYCYFEEYGGAFGHCVREKQDRQHFRGREDRHKEDDRRTIPDHGARTDQLKHNNTNKEHELKEKTVEDEILEALTEFTDALKKGEVMKRFNCRQVKLNLHPTPYNPELVKKTRKLMRMSQTLFARFLGVSPKTVRAWEQGFNEPHPMACRFMDEIRLKPEYWIARFKEIAVTKYGNRKIFS